jgi:hypothetical protein
MSEPNQTPTSNEKPIEDFERWFLSCGWERSNPEFFDQGRLVIEHAKNSVKIQTDLAAANAKLAEYEARPKVVLHGEKQAMLGVPELMQQLNAANERVKLLEKENIILRKRVSEYQPFADAALAAEKGNKP